MNPVRLLAKSVPLGTDMNPPYPATLPGHLTDTAEVASALLDVRLDEVLDAHQLSAIRWRQPFRDALLRAAGIHDLGKANEQFQSLVRGAKTTQAVRHEALSLAILAACPELDAWLFAALEGPVRFAVLRAVAGHHLKFDLQSSLSPQASGSISLRMHTSHPDFQRSLEALGDLLKIPSRPPTMPDILLPLSRRIEAVPNLTEAILWWKSAGDELRRFSAALAAMLIAADVAASAAGRRGDKATDWAPPALRAAGTAAELADAGQRRLAGRPIRPFQSAVSTADANTVLATAGCGTGKTTAAWLWASNRLPNRKLFFCYPTTGTASEGFIDYAWPEFAGDARLLHSRAELDAERILCSGDDDVLDLPLKLDALSAWGAKAVVCTVDTVLGLMQNYRSGLFGYPALVGAGFVFDEVHLYDRKLFGALLRFLQLFPGSPVLLMTASLQSGRRDGIRAAVSAAGRTLQEIPGPPDLEHLKRYVLRDSDRDSALGQAMEVARAGGRVLWVTNTVGRAMEAADSLASQGTEVVRYHSRYRYMDRLEHHGSVISAMGPKSARKGVVAVTTQVCEVSLDISADLLISELAPAPSLIQRCGRLNRWALPEQRPPPLTALVIEPPSPQPYEPEDIAQAREWLGELVGRPVSQYDLSSALESVLEGEPAAQADQSRWADFAWEIRRDTVREDGVTANFVRAEDVPYCSAAGGRLLPIQIAKYSIPMTTGPVMRELGSWNNLAHRALVAPVGRIEYDAVRGAQWRK